MNATRFALKPIPQPPYRFCNVPCATKDLSGSTVQCVTDREAWQACMGEMLLVCKEAIRRRRRQIQQPEPLAAAAAAAATEEEDDRKPAATATTAAAPTPAHASKPLSLEYIADRLDVDDPMWGYVIRHNGEMLQGFITVTTFTNYQRTFRWDSSHPCSFQLEDEEHGGHGHNDGNVDTDKHDVYDMANRKVDTDGSLAREMNATVRAGDIWNEGIVWPRIAEIGLLGGLACGRTLVKLVIEQLECIKPSARANYDYVVLQATDNSIPFYESLGFVRVGAVMQQENITEDEADFQESANSSSNSSSDTDGDEEDVVVAAEPLASDDSQQGSDQQPTALATPCALVSSKTKQYTTTKGGETPTQIAKKLLVNVYDIIFLNQSLYPELVPSSKMRAGTILLIPDEVVASPPPPEPPLADDQKMEPQQQQQPQQPVWYIAKENETPRSIARKLGLNCIDLVNANKMRLQGLLSSSRLKDGTRVKVSQLDVLSPTELYKPYAHWTFPDDKFEEGEPSYMMALKLNRCSTSSSSSSINKRNKERPFASSLAVPVVDYEPNNSNINNKLLSTDSDQPPAASVAAAAAAQAAAAAAAGPPRPGRASRRRWQSHQDAESSSSTDNSNTSSTTTMTNEDDDDDDVIQEKMPKPPLKPAFVEPYRLFVADYKRDHGDLLYKKHVGEISRITGDAWRKLSPREKQAYDQRIALFKHEYESAMQVYREKVASIRRAKEQRRLKKLGLLPAAAAAVVAAAAPPQPQPLPLYHPSINLFNKVVKLKPGSSAMTEGSLHLYEYWYVLTYIPDLQWCHLAPLYKIGRVFGDDKPNSMGRPIWKLVDEELGEEVDISSSLVIPVKAKSMKRTLDADKEEWDIIGTPLPLTAPPPSRSNSFGSGFSSSQMQPVSRRGSFCDSTCDGSSVAAATSTTTAGTSRKRKRSSFGSDVATPSAAAAASSKQQPSFAMAVMPQTRKRVKVWIKLSPGRGRPKGSKNKKPKLVPNHVVTTGKKKPPPSSYNTDNNSNNNNNNEEDGNNKNSRSSHLLSTRNNSRVKLVMPPMDVMASLEHASSPLVKKKQSQPTNSKKPPPAKARLLVAESQNSHSAVMPANRKTRNSTASMASDEMGGTLAAKHATSLVKQSTRSSAKGRLVAESQNSHSAVLTTASRSTRNSKASFSVDGTGGALTANLAASPIKQSTRSSVKGRCVAESQNKHAAVLPAVSRTTRNSKASLAAEETGGALAAKPASSPVKQSTRSSVKGRCVADSHSTIVPVASRSTRNSKASLAACETAGALAVVDQSDHGDDSQAASVPPALSFPVGSVVLVQARTWPGCNKPGGVAHVTRVQQDESILYDVKYVLGGREKDIDAAFLSWHDNNNTTPVSNSEAAVEDKQSSLTEKQPNLQITSQESTPPVEDQPSSSLPLVNHPASTASASFPVGAVVVVQGRRRPGCNKPGGVARVTRVQQGDSILYDVKYVLGGSEKSVEESLLSWHNAKVVRAARSTEVVAGNKASTTEKQQEITSQKSMQPVEEKSTSLVKHPGSQAAAHTDEDAIASGGENNNSQPERTSSRLQTKRFSTLALLDDGTRGRGTPRSKSVRTRTRSSMESSSSILTEVAPYPNKRSNKRVRRADGTFLPSPTSTRRVRDPLELLMP